MSFKDIRPEFTKNLMNENLLEADFPEDDICKSDAGASKTTCACTHELRQPDEFKLAVFITALLLRNADG